MKNKCEWKDGKFKPCEDDFPNNLYECRGYYFCPFCGADIRKPEPPKGKDEG